MKVQALVLALLVELSPLRAAPQSQPPSQPAASVLMTAARVLDVRHGSYIENAAIWIEGERIKEVGRVAEVAKHVPENTRRIDLGGTTVLPGLIDCHTHIMARIPDSPEGYTLTLATKSQAFRALEGAFNARITLRAGFTTVRDVENEGSGYADVALRDAIEQGLAEGPRMQVATRGIAAVGQYNPFGVSPDLPDFPTGAQMVSGIVIDAFTEDPNNAPKTLEQRNRRQAFLQAIQESIQQAMTLGVNIASGFDASSPELQGRNAGELVALTKRGMPSLESIRAATLDAAELLGWQDRVGAIEPGKYADLIAVEGDPLADITVLQQIRFVMKGGVIAKDLPSH